MRIVQIAGPAYCGSTALGFVLNTIPGFFLDPKFYCYLKVKESINMVQGTLF